MFWKRERRYVISILGSSGDIREITSETVTVDRSVSYNVISQNLAKVLGCHITPLEPCLALVGREPVKLTGSTSVLVRRPKTAKVWTTIECKIAEQTMNTFVLCRSTQKKLRLYKQHKT